MALTKITPQMFDTSAAGHDFNIDNGTFVVDASANRVGIGTASPGTPLHITGITTFDGDGASRAEITSSTANSVVSLDVGGFNGTPSVARDIRFLTNAAANAKTERMRISSAGHFIPATDSTYNIGANGTRFANAYFDNVYGTLATAAQTNITSLGTLTGLTMSGNLNLNDDVILRLGTSNEFQIYHTSSGNSIISETGSGNLFIDGNNIYLRKDTSSGEAFADFIGDGAASLYHNGTKKFETTGSGISVTGGVTASRFDATTASTTDPVLQLTDSGVADYDFTFPDTSTIQLGTNTTSTKHFKLLNAGSGSFNLDVEGSITSGSTIQGVGTGTAAAFQLPWATSAIALRMAYDANYYMSIETHAQTRDLILTSSTNDATANIRFKTSGTGASNLADRMVIDHNGFVGVGVTPSGVYRLQVNGGISLSAKSLIDNSAYFISGTNGFRWNNSTDAYNNCIMYDNGNMYVRSDLGIGTVPSYPLHVETIDEVATVIQSNNNNGTHLVLRNSDATTGRKVILNLAPANNVTGAYVGAEAMEDFSVVNNRTADIFFETRKDGTLSEKMRIKGNGTITVGGDPYRFVDTVYRRSFNLNRAYTQVANINGSGLGSSYEVHVRGTTGSVVVNAHFHIMVGHYKDIAIKSFGGAYTACKVKVVSNNNEDSSLYIGIASTNNATANCLVSIRPHDTAGVDMSPSSSESAGYLEHAQSATSTQETTTGTSTTGSGPTNAYSI